MRGFTLIELTACLLIIAVLAALLGPRFTGTQPFDQRGYADELAAALRYADDLAVATGCNVSFTVTAVPAQYSAAMRAAAGNTCAAAGAYGQNVLWPDGTPLSGSPPSDANVTRAGTIVFGAAGQVVSWSHALPASFTIGTFTLTVDSSSGFVNVQ